MMRRAVSHRRSVLHGKLPSSRKCRSGCLANGSAPARTGGGLYTDGGDPGVRSLLEKWRFLVQAWRPGTLGTADRRLSQPKDIGLSYPEVGASATTAPTGYNADHNRVQLGSGAVTWQRATKAIRFMLYFQHALGQSLLVECPRS